MTEFYLVGTILLTGWIQVCEGTCTHSTQKMKFSIKGFFSKYDKFPVDLVTFLKKSSMKNFIFCVVVYSRAVSVKGNKLGKKDRVFLSLFLFFRDQCYS